MWRKSSYSCYNGSCLEAAFQKSSYSESGNCAEVAVQGEVLVHDTKECKDPGRCAQMLAFSPGAWNDFIAGIKAGDFR